MEFINYFIKINIDTTYIYKFENNNLYEVIDNTGKFPIPNKLYISSNNNEENLYGNEAIYKIFKTGYKSDFLEKYDKVLLLDFLIYIFKILNDKHSLKEQESIYFNIIIPNSLSYKQTINLKTIYTEIIECLNLEKKVFVFKEEIDLVNYIFIELNELNTIIKFENEYFKLNRGITYLKEELINCVISKFKIKLNSNDILKIKRYIYINFNNILQNIKINKYTCIFELNNIYSIEITKNDLYNSIKTLEKDINKVICKFKTKKILSYNLYFEIIFKKIYDCFLIFEYENYDNNFLQNWIKNNINKKSQLNFVLEKSYKCPISLGLNIESGLMCRFINRNVNLPYKKTKMFVYKNQENVINIGIYKGNNLYVKDNTLLEEILCNFKINKHNKEGIKIKITFQMDNIEYLNVRIENVSTNEVYEKNVKLFLEINNEIDKENDNDSEEEFKCLDI